MKLPMPADLTSRVRAKLAEVKHAEDCDTGGFVLEQQVRHCETGDFLTLKPHCTCDRAARVADLVYRMLVRAARWAGPDINADYVALGVVEAALAVPIEKEGD